jgi:hypothetical protein
VQGTETAGDGVEMRNVGVGAGIPGMLDGATAGCGCV